MLPTTGFFKNIDCPYYENSCERPYCHFKHRKKVQESSETSTTSAPLEIPTYNPTPKSQLANSKSHIPISYVPDLAVRSERNHRRSVASYVYSASTSDKPTYNPTPLSILSTGKVSESTEPKYSPTYLPEISNDINFEDLETEFDMIDELISDSGAAEETTNGEEEVKAKVEKKKHNGSVSKSKSKSRSHKSSSNSSKSDSKHKKDDGKTSSKGKSSSRDDDKKKSKSEEKEKKVKDKKKHEHSSSRHKENSSDKNKHKSRERDKEKQEKQEKCEKREKERKKHKESKKSEVKVTIKPEVLQVDEVNDDFNSNDYAAYEDSDLEEDTLEECYKIFTEYKPTEPDIFAGITDRAESQTVDVGSSLFGKRRVAHENVNNTQSKVLFSKPKSAPTPAQAMVNRLKAVRLAHANNEQNNIINEMNRYKRPAETPVVNEIKKIPKVTTTKPSTSTSLVDDIITGKSSKPRRIAPVQNVNSIQRAKAKIEEFAKLRAITSITSKTPQTTTKTKRVAHIPEAPTFDIPEVLESERSKLPVNVRTRFMKMITDECIKLYLSTEEAQHRALTEEFKCYERCAALVTYRNSAMLAISRLRKELQEREMSGLGPILPGETPQASKDNKSELHGRKFYDNIKRFILNDDELILHGFPREGTIPGRAIVKSQRKIPKGYLSDEDRTCCRCTKLYKVDDDGFPLYPEECIYHPLKKRTFRGESIYLCCKSSEDIGCVTSTTHVSEAVIPNDSEIDGYQTTLPPEYEDDPRSHEVFALDCEMCYTTKGLELTRVTVVNSECKTVYESLVKPLNSIIDYNTRFSGITEEQMNRTATSILQVQANILHLCNSNTILIGHSLESDMKALKIIHNTIIDTSVLFPHKFGLPHKRALRDLAREYLKKIIQNDISGHDSAEDALTCMELVQWKLKEELKVRGIKV